MNIETWYKGLMIPSFSDKTKMTAFVHGLSSIWSDLMGDFAKPLPSIHFVDSNDFETAAADIKNNKILINSRLWSPRESVRPFPEKTESQILSSVIGLEIHEVLHFKFTRFSFKEMFESFGVTNFNGIMHAIANVCEDAFIDTQAETLVPHFMWTYKELQALFFTNEEAKKCISAFKMPCKNQSDLQDAVNAFVMMRFPQFERFVPSNPSTKFLMDALRKVKTTESLDSRMKIAYEVYKFLVKDFEESFEDEEEFSKVMEAVAEVLEEMIGGILMSEGKQIDTDKIIKSDVNASVFEDFIRLPKGETLEFIPSEAFLRSCEGSIMSSGMSGTINPNPSYNKLANLIKARSEVQRYTGEPRDRGNKIRRIHRIATDNKIFADQIKSQFVGPQEIILLVDCSGSMRENITKAVEAAYGAAISLEKGGHNVAVYGHTSDVSLPFSFSNELIVPVFKEFVTPTSEMKRRCTIFLRDMEILHGNNDDLAIAHVGKKFTKKANTKTLIVISDGAPASSRISGKRGIEATKKQVDELRTRGIKVISISIKSSAVACNNIIYGRDFNVDNEDPNVAGDIIKKMFK